MDIGVVILSLIIGVLIIIGLNWFVKRFVNVDTGNLTLITGGVKCGKTSFTLALSVKKYKLIHKHWKFVCFIRKIFNRDLPEEPLFYSNIPIAGIPYHPLTKDLLLRKKRFRFGSVVFISEASLVADSKLIKNEEINLNLLLFYKLIAHETHEGYVFVETQNYNDNHYSLKRSLSNYIYIDHLIRWIPFIVIAKIRVERYTEDNNVINVYSDSTTDSMRSVIFNKKIFKMYDKICYSCKTDNLVCEDSNLKYITFEDVKNNPNLLKAVDIVSFRNDFN